MDTATRKSTTVIDLNVERDQRGVGTKIKISPKAKGEHMQILFSDALAFLRTSAPEVAESSLAIALDVRTACVRLGLSEAAMAQLVECAQIAYIGLAAVPLQDREAFRGAPALETSITLLNHFGLEVHARYICAYRETFESGVNFLNADEGILCAALALSEKTHAGMPLAAAVTAVRRLGYGEAILEALSDPEPAYKTG